MKKSYRSDALNAKPKSKPYQKETEYVPRMRKQKIKNENPQLENLKTKILFSPSSKIKHKEKSHFRKDSSLYDKNPHHISNRYDKDKSYFRNSASFSYKKSIDSASKKLWDDRSERLAPPDYDVPKRYKKSLESTDKSSSKKYEYNSHNVSKKKHLIKNSFDKKFVSTKNTKHTHNEVHFDAEDMRLNKYIAHCGIAARRKADELIAGGLVSVNGLIITEMGYRVKPMDKVMFKNQIVKPTQHFIYLLLNKPKDTLTSADDDRGRRTVLDLIRHATDQRVFPVGRLDRNTTGVLLITNDGELTKQLTHPSFEIDKVYQVELDKPVTKEDMHTLINGVQLDDGIATVDNIAYPDPSAKKIVGVEIHSGRNRIVRRMFESLGYQVERLDRVMFAGLTKKNLARGKYRFLSDKEIIMLKKMVNKKK